MEPEQSDFHMKNLAKFLQLPETTGIILPGITGTHILANNVYYSRYAGCCASWTNPEMFDLTDIDTTITNATSPYHAREELARMTLIRLKEKFKDGYTPTPPVPQPDSDSERQWR